MSYHRIFPALILLIMLEACDVSSVTKQGLIAASDRRDEATLVKGLATRAKRGDTCSAVALWMLQVIAKSERNQRVALANALQSAGIDETPSGLDLLHSLADKGEPTAQLLLALIYHGGLFKGEDFPRDPTIAEKWFARYAEYAVPAAERGDANAQWNLSSYYQSGLGGFPMDETETVKWLRKAADQGHIESQQNLAILYQTGRGVQQDKAEAVRWFRKAAEQGDPISQRELGSAYWYADSDDQGVVRNLGQAFHWLKKAADQGDAAAQNELGSMFEGTPQDYLEAAKWYQSAADQDDWWAKRNLARAYASGRGVTKNIIMAHMWFNLAGDGDQRAALEKEMTTEQINKAQALAREWRPKLTPIVSEFLDMPGCMRD